MSSLEAPMLDGMDPFEFFAQMLGGAPAAPVNIDFSVVDPLADVVPIAGDSSTSPGLPQDDANLIMGDYRPLPPDSTPAIDNTIRAIGMKIVPPLVPVLPLPPGAVIYQPVGPNPESMQLDTETVPPSEIVPIAGDSSEPPPAPSSGIPAAMSSDIADTAEDAAGGAQDPTGIFAYFVAAIRSHPWIAASLGAVLLALAIALPLGLSGGPSSPRATPPTTTAVASTPTTTASAATTTAIAAPAVTAADVAIANFSLAQPQGFQFSLQAPANAPAHETVTLAFTGPGLPHTAKVVVAAGHAVPLKYVTSGCGKWTVSVVAIDGKAIASKGNPNLENGMTHAC